MTRSKLIFNEKMRRRAEKGVQYTGEVAKQLSIRHMTQTELAKHLGVSLPTLRKWLRHPETQTISQMHMLCDFLDIPEETYRDFV